MTELLKVLKFIAKRAKKRMHNSLCRLKAYRGIYAFLGGIVIFSVCFAGKGNSGFFSYNGSYAALTLPALNGFTDYLSTERPVSLSSEAGALLSVSEAAEKKAQRVPYNVFSVSYSALDKNNGSEENISPLSLGAIDGVTEANGSEKADVAAPEKDEAAYIETAPEEENEETALEITPEEESGETDEAVGAAPEKEEDENVIDSQWQPLNEIKYVNTDLIYSRREAKEGSEKINRYRINDAVEVKALTDTHYYKLKNGEFIHEDYLSDEESPKWTEETADGIMYVKNSGVYSREEALEGSEKVSRYNLNDTVTVSAVTNTGYYRIGENEFIHSDFLSPAEVKDYPLSAQYGQRAQTASEQSLSQQVFDTVNAVRAEYGLAPFKQLDSLNAAANERAWETTFYNSHTRPDGTRCFTVFDEYGLKNPSSKAENIAKWYSSAQAVVNAWMSDYAHRSAILGDHEYMGVGCYYISGDYYGYYWAQVFYTP